MSDDSAPSRLALAHVAKSAAFATIALGVCDALLSLRRSPAPLGESTLFIAGVIAALAWALIPLSALAAKAILSLKSQTLRVRIALSSLAGSLFGLALGVALFSGSAMLRSSRRPLLIAAVTIVSAALFAALGAALQRIEATIARSRAAFAACAALGALAVGYAHATMFVRLYPALHAIAAALTASLAVAAISLAAPTKRRASRGALIAIWSVFFLAVVGFGVELLRSQRARARARQQSAMATYVVRSVARWIPQAPVRSVVDDDRFVEGPSLDLEGLDIVLVTVDALRWDRLGAYGHRGGLTPAIDDIAREGVTIERAYCTTPHTSYSLASLMTGKFFRGVSALGAPARPHHTMAGLLAQRGFATAAYFPPAVFAVDGDRLGDLRARGFDFSHRVEDYSSAEQRVRTAISWLESQPRSKRTFLWVHLFEPHESYEAHPGARVPGSASVAARYDSEVAAVDDAIRVLRDAYARLGRRAAWFVTADHGEEFGEHGGRFHGTTVYDEQARVPFIIAVPGLLARRAPGPVSHVDLLPTLLAGLSIDRPARLRGRDLGPLAHGATGSRNVFASVGAERLVTDATFKLVCDVSEGSCELFDIERDPLERNNLADSRLDVLSRLRPLIAGWDASHARFEAEGTAQDSRSSSALPASVERAVQGDHAAAIEAASTLSTLDASRAIRAVRALAALGERAPAVLAALFAATSRNAADLAIEAGVALARLGDRRGVAACRDALASNDLALKRSAALGLAIVRERDGVSVLAQWLDDRAAPDSERDAVIAALRPLRDSRAFDAYVRLLDDPRLAPEGALALAELDDPRAIEPLTLLARSTRYALTRNAAVLGLAQLRAPVAETLFREALTSEPALSDPFAIARRIEGSIEGVLASLTPSTSDARGRTRIALSPPTLRGSVTVTIAARASIACDAHVGSGTVEVTPAWQLHRVTLRSLPARLVIDRCPGLEVSGVLAATPLPSVRGGR